MREHDLIMLRAPLPDYALPCGAIGTVVHIHADRAGIEAEFSYDDGRTRAVLTLSPAGYQVIRDDAMSPAFGAQPPLADPMAVSPSCLRVARTRRQCDRQPG